MMPRVLVTRQLLMHSRHTFTMAEEHQPIRGLYYEFLTNERRVMMLRDAMTITEICYSLANNSRSN